MLTPEQIEGLQIAYERLMNPVIEFLLQDIARRVQKAGKMTSTAAYQLYRLQMLSKDLPQVQEKLQKMLDIAADDAAQLLEKAAEMGYNSDVERLGGTVKFQDNEQVQKILQAAVNLTKGELSNVTQTLGFVNYDGTARDLTQAYINATDFAFNQTITGATDYNTAIRRACQNLANENIQVIRYVSEKGRKTKTSIEVAVRRNIMSGTGQMVEEISQRNFDDLGADGWEISAHANCAPDHELIQGKVYTDEEYKRLNSHLKRRIGTLNCGHTASPIIIGVNQPQYSKKQLNKFIDDNEKPVSYEGKTFKTMYEATQYQRKIERAIRTQKRRVMLATDDDAAAAKSKLNVLRQEYKRFSKAVGMRTEDERLFVSGFGRNKK